jgi:diadenosine tetraphosphate (Ap4A) HIT family hydrolase
MSKSSPFNDERVRLLENSIGFVIFDKYPVSIGHCLIVPHRIYPNYFDSSAEEVSGLNDLLIKAKAILDKDFSPDGYNVGINCGEYAGQTIPHVHIHLIPRYEGDVSNPNGGVRGVIPKNKTYTEL